MFKQSNDEINFNIELAKEYIFKACGQEAKGFRAPVFSIPETRKDIFGILQNHFEYDSSFVIDLSKKDISDYQKESPFNLSSMKEFPIIPKTYFFNTFRIKSGGTFLRLFSKKTTLDVMNFSYQNGFIPLVYMHPYDYLYSREFWVPYSEFKNNGFFKDAYTYLRQIQWLMTGNKKVFNKIDFILENFSHAGRMDNLLK